MSGVAVLGGGLVGASAAYRLATAGTSVTVVDAGEAGQATAAGAGVVFPGSRVLHGDAALLPLVAAAVASYPTLLAELADDGQPDTGYDVVGGLYVAVDDDEARQLAEVGRVLRERAARIAGLDDVAPIDGDRARRLCPPLGDVAAALYVPMAARVDGRRLRRALLAAARRRGANHVEGRGRLCVRDGRVTGVRVEHTTLSADAVIVAAGAWSSTVAEGCGVRLPVTPQRGQLAHLLVPDVDTSGWPIVTGVRSTYLLAFPPDRVVVGATREDDAGFDHRVTAGGVHRVLDDALRLAPGLAEATVEELRVGFRPVTPDGKPLLGALPGVDGAFVATGHGPYGLQVGPYSGAVVADMALGRRPAIDVSAFAPGRFSRSGEDEAEASGHDED